MCLTKVAENIKTHVLCSIILFWKSSHLWDNVEKCGRARQATDKKYNMVQKTYTLHDGWLRQEYRHTQYLILITVEVLLKYREFCSLTTVKVTCYCMSLVAMDTCIWLTTPMPTTINRGILLHFYGNSGYANVLHCFGKGSALCV